MRAGRGRSPQTDTSARRGRIGGRGVRCLDLETQLTTHGGYELDDDDRHDLALLESLLA